MVTQRAGIRALADLLTPMSVRVAATLGIADHIADGYSSAGEIAERCAADEFALDRLLRHLCTIGLVEREGERYALTPAGEELRADHPGGRRPWLDLNSGVGRGDLCFIELFHTITTGEPAYPVRYGSGFWEDLERDSALSASFDALMNHHVALDKTHDGLISVFPWGAVREVVDVGGGNGALALALLSAYPHLRATIVDRSGPISRARRDIADQGLEDRARAVVGDFFEPLPPGGDVYVLSAIIHDWDDERAESILRRCAQAAGHHGTVLVIEAVGADGEEIATAMDLRMLAYSGGRERGVRELTALAARAGLTHRATHPIPRSRYMSVLEFTSGATKEAN